MKSVFAYATIQQTIPFEFAIYDLKEFSDACAHIKHRDGSVEVHQKDNREDCIILKNGRREVLYYASASSVVSPGYKQIIMPETKTNTKFIFSNVVLKKILKASRVMKLKYLDVISTGLRLHKSNYIGNMFEQGVPGMVYGGEDVCIEVENLKLMPLDYDAVSYPDNSGGILRCTSRDERFKVVYYIVSGTMEETEESIRRPIDYVTV